MGMCLVLMLSLWLKVDDRVLKKLGEEAGKLLLLPKIMIKTNC